MASARVLTGIVVIGLLFAADGFACSPVDGYLKPSNYELVKQTDAIVLAQAVAFGAARNTSENGFTFKVLEVVKGDFREPSIFQTGAPAYLGSSDPDDFSSPRRGAGTGACNAYDYQVGKQFLLFLNRSGAGWNVSGPPFSRINEEVLDAQAPWVAAVRLYSRISSLNDYEAEKRALIALQRQASHALANDIDVHFRTPSGAKSYADLRALYDAALPPERRKVLWAFAEGKHREAAPLIAELIRSDDFVSAAGGRSVSVIAPVADYVQKMDDQASVAALAEAYLRIRNNQLRWPIMWALIRVADGRHAALMLQALRSADAGEAGRLAAWFAKFPSDEAFRILRGHVGERYDANFDLTFGLAAMGAEEVLEWSKTLLDGTNKSRWMAITIIACSPLGEADRIAKAIIRNGPIQDVFGLFESYVDSILPNENPNRWDRLRDIIIIHGRDPALRKQLRPLLEMQSRSGDAKASELLKLWN